MPQTCFVWAEDQDRSGVETGLLAVPDDQTVTSGDTIQIPEIYPYIAGIYAGTETTGYPLVDARLASTGIAGPGINNLRIHRGGAGVTRNEGCLYDFFDNPVKFGEGPNGLAGDTLTAFSLENDHATTLHINYIVLFVTDTKLPEMPHTISHMPKFTMAAISAGVDAAGGDWEKKALVLDDDIPVGRYLLWGIDVVSATAIAARVIIPGLGFRPAFVPRRTEAEAGYRQPNRCIHPGGVPFSYKGGTLTIKVEYLAETTDTALSGTLYIQYLGK